MFRLEEGVRMSLNADPLKVIDRGAQPSTTRMEIIISSSIGRRLTILIFLEAIGIAEWYVELTEIC